MPKLVKATIQFRRATTAEWEQYKDVVPAAGEPCFDTELGTLKIGNGVKSYGDLEPIGGAGKFEIAADGKSIILEDGVFKLAGFDAAEVGAQPRKNADGSIEWVVPSTETVEGLQSAVAGLQSDMATVQGKVDALQEIVGTTEEGSVSLLDRVESLETKLEGTGEDTVEALIDAKINDFATKINDNDVVDSYKELIDYVAEHGGEAAAMAADIADLKSKIGETSVLDQIEAAVAGKVDAEEGKSLVEDTLIEKLVAIEAGAQENKIEAVKLGDTLLEIVDKCVTIPVGAGLKTSDEVIVNEDGSLAIGTISFDKIVQNGDMEIVFDGGGAA